MRKDISGVSRDIKRNVLRIIILCTFLFLTFQLPTDESRLYFTHLFSPPQQCTLEMISIVRYKKWCNTEVEHSPSQKCTITSSKLNKSQKTSPLSRVSHKHNAHLHRGKLNKDRRWRKAVSPFALTVEDLETTTATTSWISSGRVGAPCPLRKSGPCSSGWGISRCPKSLFVSLGRSCALRARGGAERSQPGSAASTDVWAPSCSRRFRCRQP